MRDFQRTASRFEEPSILMEAMTNLLPKRTGVQGAAIWVSPGEFGGTDSQHGPRVKVVLGEETTTEGLDTSVSVTITNPSRILGTLPGKIQRQVVPFIIKNRDVLLRHWRGELDSGDVFCLIERV